MGPLGDISLSATDNARTVSAYMLLCVCVCCVPSCNILGTADTVMERKDRCVPCWNIGSVFSDAKLILTVLIVVPCARKHT